MHFHMKKYRGFLLQKRLVVYFGIYIEKISCGVKYIFNLENEREVEKGLQVKSTSIRP